VGTDKEKQWALLMRAANLGDAEAYRKLLLQLTPVLRSFARRGLARAGLGDQDTEDIVQERGRGPPIDDHWSSPGCPPSWSQMIGSNSVACLVSIPFLAAVPLGCALLALRHGAPERPDLAGAAAGVFAGAIGAAF
jgi:hypothetical protein